MVEDDPFNDDRVPSSPVVCPTKTELDTLPGLIEADNFVWLSLQEPSDEQVSTAGEEFRLHPLTTEDLHDFNQRAKVEEYDKYIYIVAYGATASPDADGMVEVHLVFAPSFLLTVTAEPLPDLERLHREAPARNYKGAELLHAVLDLLVDSYGPLLDDIDAEVEVLEEQVIDRNLRDRELDIHNVRRKLGRLDRIIHRQSEAFTRLPEALRRLPDHELENVLYFRDVQDHLIRISDATDGMRERVSGVFELYLAALDNRQNVIMKQFTVISGIFLPLSVITGFFGMNFGWLVQNIDTMGEFLAYGVGIPILVLVGMVRLIRARGLFED